MTYEKSLRKQETLFSGNTNYFFATVPQTSQPLMQYFIACIQSVSEIANVRSDSEPALVPKIRTCWRGSICAMTTPKSAATVTSERTNATMRWQIMHPSSCTGFFLEVNNIRKKGNDGGERYWREHFFFKETVW